MKLRQFLQGFVYANEDTNGNKLIHPEIVQIHTAKIDMLREMVDTKKKKQRSLEGIGNAVIVYFFKPERDLLRSLFPDAPAIDSRTPETEVSSIIAAWNKGQLPVVLANSASLNYGLNMQHGGNNMLWYAMTWNAEHYTQLIDRFHRQRQEKTVFAHHIIFRNTIEERMFRAITDKNATQASVLNALRQGRM